MWRFPSSLSERPPCGAGVKASAGENATMSGQKPAEALTPKSLSDHCPGQMPGAVSEVLARICRLQGKPCRWQCLSGWNAIISPASALFAPPGVQYEPAELGVFAPLCKIRVWTTRGKNLEELDRVLMFDVSERDSGGSRSGSTRRPNIGARRCPSS